MPVVIAPERVVTLDKVEKALKACSEQERYYDTDDHQALPLRMGFTVSEVSMVFVHLRTLRRQGKVEKCIKDIDETRYLKHGGRNCRVRRVVIKLVEEDAVPNRKGRRSVGYFAR